MKWYCEKCKRMHENDELCPLIEKELVKHPEWLPQAADFTSIAGQYALISTNALDTIAKGINKVAGTNLSYEGTHQFARDIQVFKRLSEEPFKRAGTFSTPDNAKSYLEALQTMADKMKELGITDGRKNPIQVLDKKLTGYSQEVDWLRYKNSQLSSLFQKSNLLDGNAAGVDGTTVSRFTGKTISRTTIKASINPVTKDGTAITDVKEAIEKGYATKDDIIFSVKGTSQAAKDAGLSNQVIEKNTTEQAKASNVRQRQKIMAGEATTNVTFEQVTQKMAQGAVIGAAVGLTVSSITNFVRYKNGELTSKEAFSEISEDTIKSAVIGAGMGAVTIFLPGGAIGFVAGMAIGIYFNAVCTNILDEIYGKGAYGAILNSAGYVYGATYNLGEYLDKISASQKKAYSNLNRAKQTINEIDNNFELLEQMKGEY